jgi:tetratricopeptide (TPR) repeat protein
MPPEGFEFAACYGEFAMSLISPRNPRVLPAARLTILFLLLAAVLASSAVAAEVNSRIEGRALIAEKPEEPSSYIAFAEFLLGRGDEKGAEEILEIGRNKAASSAALLVVLGRVYEAQERLARAESVTREALVLDPESADAHVRMGEIYFRLGWPKSGMESFWRAHELNPELTVPMVRIVGGFVDQNKMTEAEDACLRFISEDADNADLWLSLGRVFEKQDKLREAFTTYGQVLTLDPNQSEAYARQGRLFCRFGQYEAGQTACAKALELDGDNMLAHAYMGIACSNLGDGEKARKHAQIAETGGMNMTAVWKRLQK